jgi:hypothetical protein
MITVLIFLLGVGVGALLHKFFHLCPVYLDTMLAAVSLPTPPARCYTITYTYSDGSVITKHRCQGWTKEFNDREGVKLAPPGTTLVSAKGGVHKSEIP